MISVKQLITVATLCWITTGITQAASSGAQNYDSQLAQQLSANTEILTIEKDADRFIGLLNRAISSTPLGGILLLTDPRADAEWIVQTTALRETLSRSGWTLITLQAGGEATPDETNLSRARILLDELQRLENERLVILALGTAADFGLTLATEDPTRRLVLVDALLMQHSVAELTERMQTLSNTRLLDIAHQHNSIDPKASENFDLRTAVATQLDLKSYISRQLSGTFTGWQGPQEAFVKSIAGALKTHILIPEQAITR